jgi:hypothetical protein
MEEGGEVFYNGPTDTIISQRVKYGKYFTTEEIWIFNG